MNLNKMKIGLFLFIAMFSFNYTLAKEKIDFMFPAPVDGKITLEMSKIIKEYNNSQNEVEVRGIFTGNYDTTKAKAIAAARAKQPPTLVIMSANFTSDLAIRDLILPMDELFKFDKNKISAANFLTKNFWPALHKNTKYNGSVYAIPFHNSTPILYYNKTMFTELGIKNPPKTWNELVIIAKKITASKPERWGIMLPSTNNDYGGWVLSSLVHANGGMYNNPDYPGEVYYNTPSSKGTLQFIHDLVFVHKVMPIGVLDNKQINVAFLSQKLGMTILSTGALGFMKENAKDFEMEVAMLPVKIRQAVIIGGASLVSFKGISEAQKAAGYKFLLYLVSPKISARWSRFSGYFAPRIQAYELPEMKQFLATDHRFKVALAQLKYAHPWYATYETVSVRQAMENQLARIVTDKSVDVNDATLQAQKDAEQILAPYVNKTTLHVPQ